MTYEPVSYDPDRLRILREQLGESRGKSPPWNYGIAWKTLSVAVRNAIDIKKQGETAWQNFKDELLSRLWDDERLTRLDQMTEPHREHTYREGNGDELERDIAKLLHCPLEAVRAVLIQEYFPNGRTIALELLEEFGEQARMAQSAQHRREARKGA